MSLVCYKTSHGAIDAFMRDKVLNFAFYTARDEILREFEVAKVQPSTIAALNLLTRISIEYANQLIMV